jgi:hypothetical protein
MKRKPLPIDLTLTIDLTLFASPVLITECKREFDQLREALMQDLAPRDTVEKILVDDVANLVWEKQRLRRAKTATWNMATKDAVVRLLGNLSVDPWWEGQANKLWLTDPFFRENLMPFLGKYGLGESAIAAEAMRWVEEDFRKLDRMETSLELRFQKTLRDMAEYRQAFADQARIASNRIIEAEAAPVINLLEKRQTKKAD